MARNQTLGGAAIYTIAFLVFITGVALGAAGMDVHSKGALLDAEVAMFEDLEGCGYVRHPISDMAWIYVNKGVIPPGTARYYSGRVTSANNRTVTDCIKELVG